MKKLSVIITIEPRKAGSNGTTDAEREARIVQDAFDTVHKDIFKFNSTVGTIGLPAGGVVSFRVE